MVAVTSPSEPTKFAGFPDAPYEVCTRQHAMERGIKNEAEVVF